MAREKVIAADSRVVRVEQRMEEFKSRIKDLEAINKDHRAEIRRLRHYDKQQGDLDNFLKEDLKEYLPVTASKVQNTEVEKEAAEKVDATDMLRVRLLESQVNLQMIKLDLIRTSLKHLEGEERTLQELSKTAQTMNEQAGKSSSKINMEVRGFSSELKKVKKGLEQQFREGEKELAIREKELSEKEREFNVSTEIRVETYADLVSKLQTVITNIKKENVKKIRDLEVKHDKEINEFMIRLQVSYYVICHSV